MVQKHLNQARNPHLFFQCQEASEIHLYPMKSKY